MLVNFKEFLGKCGLEDVAMYPGKRFVRKMPQPGEYKSHSAVFDWHSDLLRVDIRAGLSGRALPAKELKKFPISFQSPTFVEIAAVASNWHDDDEDEEGSEGKSGDDGGMVMKKRINAFSQVVRGRIPDMGEVKRLVVMGKEIAQGAMQAVLDSLAAQIRNLTVTPVNILASVTSVTRVAPGGRLSKDIDPSLLHGAKPYTPQDMFGVPNPNG